MFRIILLALLAGSAANAQSPCAADSTHRQFDFWIGEWNVRNAEGKVAGTSSIRNILGGCVIFENYTATSGYEGKSFNFVDPATGKWRQTWVDNKGGKIEFSGERERESMTFFVEAQDADGKQFRRRMRFFPLSADTVRQFSERTYDDGKSWYSEYDLTYARKDSAKDK